MARKAFPFILNLRASPSELAKLLSTHPDAAEIELSDDRFAFHGSLRGTITRVPGGTRVELAPIPRRAAIRTPFVAAPLFLTALVILLSLGLLSWPIAFCVLPLCIVAASLIASRTKPSIADQRRQLETFHQVFSVAPLLLLTDGSSPATGGPPLLDQNDARMAEAPEVHRTFQSDSLEQFASAPVTGSMGLRLSVKHGHIYRISAAPPERTGSLGDPAFDDQFVTLTNDLPLARVWLSPHIRERLLALCDDVSFELSDGVLRLFRQRWMSPADQERAVVLARLIAGRAVELLGEWRHMGAALGGIVRSGGVWSADGQTTIEVDRAGQAITVDCSRERFAAADRSPQLFTRVRTPRVTTSREQLIVTAAGDEPRAPELPEDTAATAMFDSVYRVHGSRAAVAVLSRLLIREILDCRPLHLHLDAGHVTLLFDGLERDIGRLSAACDLVVALAARDSQAASIAPYR